MLVLTAACVAAVVIAVWWRVLSERDRGHEGTPALALTIITPLALTVFAVAGPLRDGWARRAGTPKALLPHAAKQLRASTPAAASRVTVPTIKAPFQAQLAGSVRQIQTPTGVAVVDLVMRMQGDTHGLMGVRIIGDPLEGGGIQMRKSLVTLGPDSHPRTYRGQIEQLDGNRLLARVRDAHGRAIALVIDVNVDAERGSVTGRVRSVSGAGA